MSNSQDATLAYQGLQPDDILTSVESLGYRCDGRFLALNSYENRVYRIGIEDQPPVVTKFYRPARWSDEGILEEHAFSMELAEQDIPVVPPNVHDSKTLHKYGAFRFRRVFYTDGPFIIINKNNKALIPGAAAIGAGVHRIGAGTDCDIGLGSGRLAAGHMEGRMQVVG